MVPVLEWYKEQVMDDKKVMSPIEYAEFCRTVVDCPESVKGQYLFFGLVSELGEVATLLKKKLCDDAAVEHSEIVLELGDIAYYIASMFEPATFAELLSFPIEPVTVQKAMQVLLETHDPAYWRVLCIALEVSPHEAIEASVAKLLRSKEAGTLHGGDR